MASYDPGVSSPWEPQRDGREGQDPPGNFATPEDVPSPPTSPPASRPYSEPASGPYSGPYSEPASGPHSGSYSEPSSSNPYGPSPYALEPYADPYAADRAYQQQNPYAQPSAPDPYSGYPAGPYTPYPQGPYTPASYGSYPGGPPVSGLAVAALVCGILGFFTAGVASIAAVICGHLAWRETSSGQNTGHGMTIAGLVLGYIPIVGWTLFWLFFVVAGISSI